MPATFWLTWHLLRDRDLHARISYEADACRTSEPIGFDTTKLCRQPLLQSSYAETLRKYVAVYIIRRPEHEDAQILEYKVPRGKMMVISSAMAHMDKRNWRMSPQEKHSVDTFWADRFLTYSTNAPEPALPSLNLGDTTAVATPARVSTSDPSNPKFSLNGYNGAWIPFGGGIHQCPGRHWVKLQMLLSFAVINAAFEIEILGKGDGLSVDMRKYGLGCLQPAEKAGFRIRRRKAAVRV